MYHVVECTMHTWRTRCRWLNPESTVHCAHATRAEYMTQTLLTCVTRQSRVIVTCVTSAAHTPGAQNCQTKHSLQVIHTPHALNTHRSFTSDIRSPQANVAIFPEAPASQAYSFPNYPPNSRGQVGPKHIRWVVSQALAALTSSAVLQIPNTTWLTDHMLYIQKPGPINQSDDKMINKW